MNGRKVLLVAVVGVGMLGVVVALSGSAVAAPRETVSNVQLLLDDSVVLSETGDSVALFGYIHVQTNVNTATALVGVKANVTADFVAYTEDPPSSPDPELQQRLEELKARASQLKSEIVATRQRILELQLQVPEECGLDLLFLPPGWDLVERCPSIGAFVAVAIRVSVQQLADLQAELRAVLDEMETLLNEIQRELGKSEPFEYTGDGANSSVSQLVASDTHIGALSLTDALGVRRSFTVRLGLSFSPTGTLRSGTVALACEATGVCFPDSG